MKETAKTKDQLIAELKELRKDAAAMKELKRYKTICDRAGYGIVIRDLTGHFAYINDAFARMHGYTPEELAGKHYSIMHTPEQVKHVDSLEKTRRLKGGFIAEINHKRRDGTILDMNNSASTVFGYPRDEMLSANIRDFEYPEDGNGNVTHFRKILKQGFHRFAKKYRSRKGRALYLECSANFVEMGEDSFFFVFFRDITREKKTEEELKKRDKELKRKNRHLEEANTALRVLLKRRDRDKAELEEKVLYNVKELVEPVLERLKRSRLSSRQQTYVSILESNLDDIVSPFARRLLHTFIKLTPTEIQITNFIREGKTTKEIGNLMNTSMRTVEFHRKNIRKKLGIKNRKENLRSHLLALR